MPMPLDWDKLRIFHAAAEAGSFTHAADKLHLSQSAISRQVSALEQDVGVKLFHPLADLLIERVIGMAGPHWIAFRQRGLLRLYMLREVALLI